MPHLIATINLDIQFTGNVIFSVLNMIIEAWYPIMVTLRMIYSCSKTVIFDAPCQARSATCNTQIEMICAI